MKNWNKSLVVIIVIGIVSLLYAAGAADFTEVDKGKVPAEFLDKSVKQLPNGIAIWDAEEAVSAIKNKTENLLWIDTRPESFFKTGTIAPAVLLCYNKNETVAPKTETQILTAETLKNAVAKVNTDASKVTVLFFCQGPKCHRSYNAALHAVSTWNYPAAKMVWFRDGYPDTYNYIVNDKKLKRRMSKYLKGDVLND